MAEKTHVQPADQPVFLLSGPRAAGKTAVAIALLRRFDGGMHITGITDPVSGWLDDPGQDSLLRDSVVPKGAQDRQEAGFVVVIDDVIDPAKAKAIVEKLPGRCMHKVMLLPDVETTKARNKERATEGLGTEIVERSIATVWQFFANQPFAEMGWHVIDSSAMSVEETVDAILLEAG